MVDLVDKKQIICDFLQRCNDYSDQKLTDYKQQVIESESHHLLALLDKMEQWQAYKLFNEHAISELKTDKLDDWF